MQRNNLQVILVITISSLVFNLILVYGISQLVFTPNIGFSFNHYGKIVDIDPQRGQDFPIQPGDQIIQVGQVSWDSYARNMTRPLVPPSPIGNTVSITYQRGSQVQTIPVTIQPHSLDYIAGSLIMTFLALAFWGIGLATVALVRPRDTRWWLMILFCYLTALWVSAGNLSSSHLFFSALVMRAAFWLNVPVSWHLHWIFPKPLKRVPFPVWIGVYALGIGMAALQLFQKVPSNLFYLAFLLAILGSLALLFMHIRSQPEHRKQLRPVMLSAFLASLPAIAITASGIAQAYPWASGIALFLLPIIPATYFYTIYRQQLGGLELRANRRISLLAYSLTSFLLLSIWFFILGNIFGVHTIATLLAISTASLVGAFSIILFPHFQHWFETRILSIPLPPSGLIETYTSRILTSLDQEHLVHLLQDEVLPSLLVRQAALLRLRPGEAIPFLVKGIEPGGLPAAADIPELLKQAGVYRSKITENPSGLTFSWARLILVSAIENQPVSLFLLGKRDPDDIYASNEIPVFQSLANQTALALLNIDQAERLHLLYQSDIERSEAERTRLARVLHDDVLNQLAVLQNSTEEVLSPKWEVAYQAAADHIREVITGLRPVMLMPYGLRAALVELIDLFNDSDKSPTKVKSDLPPGDIRYPSAVELQLFRIAQQACRNALEHSQAGTITLKGEFEHGRVSLLVEDNGVGFASGERLDLSWLLTNKHFGLAGMYERAALIGAHLRIQSYDQKGTSVQVTWSSPPE